MRWLSAALWWRSESAICPAALVVKPRLLVVPHIYADDIAVREIELARRLTSSFEVFILKWSDALHVESKSVLSRRVTQAGVAVRAALKPRSQFKEFDGPCIIEVPVWQPILLQRLVGVRKALSLCRLRNRGTLRGVIRDCEITHLLLANQLFGVERLPGVRTFYDVVDWFPEESFSSAELGRIRSDLSAIGKQVDGMFAVSKPLGEKLERECGVQIVPLPNGANIARLRSVAPAKVSALRRRLGIEDEFAIGYIGNHGSFTGVDLAVNAFLTARSRIPKMKLLIIGPADNWSRLLQATRGEGVIATGNVAPAEIAEYFNAIDIGILAQGKTTGTDFAFQIKVVEYSACRKCVVSTPLLMWQQLAWPNILLAEAHPEAWADAFVRARSMSWQPAWDRIVEEYDWQVLADSAAKTMLKAQGRN
jgi:glycosyltransferase involved in cell wall biosynthesis